MSFRAGLALGCAAAMLAAVPAASRVASQGGSFVLGWLLLAGGSALLLGPAVALARSARPLPIALLAALGGAALIPVPLMVLARVLHKNTHHRPLGAATFAVAALVLVVLASFVAWRALVRWQPSAARARLVTASILGLLALQVAALLVQSGTAPEWRGSAVDGAAALVLAFACVKLRVDGVWSDRLSRVAVPGWAVLVAVGIGLSQASLGPLVGEAAPVLSPLNGW